jgi:rRNA-processing protein FCF1
LEIVCDTDFLIKISNDSLPEFDWRRISSEYDLVTLACVVRELKGLVASKLRKTSVRAKNAIKVIDSGVIEIVPADSEGEVDQILLEYARSKRKTSLIATLDGNLLKTFERNGIGYLTLSSDKPLFHFLKQQRI